MKNVREGENESIDDETRARAMASVAGLPKSVAAPSEGVKPVAAGTLTKKSPVVTKEELAKSGMSLRDYMNKQQGLTRRQDKVDPDLRNREADAAFARERMKAVAEPTADEIANKQKKEKLNRLKTASAGAESKMRQANALRMSRADFVGDAELRGETPSALKQAASEPETRTPKRSGNLTDMLGLSSRYAKGGSVSASSRGDGIAQRGKTRGRMC
jgi:hypothetical protein